MDELIKETLAALSLTDCTPEEQVYWLVGRVRYLEAERKRLEAAQART